jgi:two-component system sensor histidine kinase ChvG
MIGKGLSFLSRISVRLLAFNLLLVFLPIAGFLYLDTYERQLLQALEHALVQQGRILAAGFSRQIPTEASAQEVLAGLEQKHEARFRVIDTSGKLLADSSRLGPRLDEVEESRAWRKLPERSRDSEEERETRQSLLYRVATIPIEFYRKFLSPPAPPLESGDFYSGVNRLNGAEIREALQGRYGAATRISSGGQRSVTLYSAIPIRNGGIVTGAVLVSQSTYRILRDLYELRLEVFRVFLLSFAAAVLITFMVATTITRPIARLRNQASELTDRRGRLKGQFPFTKRKDEIGDLSRALKELTQKLEEHIRFVESFASDVSHELKNPLASIRSATEIVTEMADPAERARFLNMIQDEVARMEHMVSGVREISRIDAQLELEERIQIDMIELSERVIEGFRMREIEIEFELHRPEQDSDSSLWVNASPERLTQVLENLIDNAVSFSPKGGRIDLSISRRHSEIVIRIEDQGPGIAEENLEAIFDRFASYRMAEGEAAKAGHLGLGLSIVKAVVEGYRGHVYAGNLREGGAWFEVALPAADFFRYSS